MGQHGADVPQHQWAKVGLIQVRALPPPPLHTHTPYTPELTPLPPHTTSRFSNLEKVRAAAAASGTPLSEAVALDMLAYLPGQLAALAKLRLMPK